MQLTALHQLSMATMASTHECAAAAETPLRRSNRSRIFDKGVSRDDNYATRYALPDSGSESNDDELPLSQLKQNSDSESLDDVPLSQLKKKTTEHNDLIASHELHEGSGHIHVKLERPSEDAGPAKSADLEISAILSSGAPKPAKNLPSSDAKPAKKAPVSSRARKQSPKKKGTTAKQPRPTPQNPAMALFDIMEKAAKKPEEASSIRYDGRKNRQKKDGTTSADNDPVVDILLSKIPPQLQCFSDGDRFKVDNELRNYVNPKGIPPCKLRCSRGKNRNYPWCERKVLEADCLPSQTFPAKQITEQIGNWPLRSEKHPVFGPGATYNKELLFSSFGQ